MFYKHCISAKIIAGNKTDKICDLMQLILYKGVTEGAQSKINNKWWNLEKKVGKERERGSCDQEHPVWWDDIWNERTGPAEAWVEPRFIRGDSKCQR